MLRMAREEAEIEERISKERYESLSTEDSMWSEI